MERIFSLWSEQKISEVWKRGWREGVGDQQRPKYSKNCPPELCSPKIGFKIEEIAFSSSFRDSAFFRDFWAGSARAPPPNPKDPAVLKIVRRSKFLRCA